MKKFALMSSTLLAFVAIPFMLTAADETTTLKGEAVDLSCYLKGMSGVGHASCAAKCANDGQPIGFVTDVDGKKVLYLVMNAGSADVKETLADVWGKQIEATGKVIDQEGLKIFQIEKVKEAS